MRLRFLGCGRLIGAIALWAVSASMQAHTEAISTSPESGAVLEQSPPHIRITFAAPARLTAAVVTQADGSERKLRFAPRGSASTFTIEDPALAIGRNEVRWTALSQDGHVVSGTIVLTVRDPGAPSD